MRGYSSSLVKLFLALHKQNSNDLWKFLLSNFYHNLVHCVQNNYLGWCIYILFAKNLLDLSSYFSRNNNCQNFFLRGLKLKFWEWYVLLKTVWKESLALRRLKFHPEYICILTGTGCVIFMWPEISTQLLWIAENNLSIFLATS